MSQALSARPGPASSPGPAISPADEALIERHLSYLAVQKHLAERTIELYGEAFNRLREALSRDKLALTAVLPHHVRGLAPWY